MRKPLITRAVLIGAAFFVSAAGAAWEVAFTSAEADAHDGHSMYAQSKFWGDRVDFTFEKPLTGPVVIRCSTP